MNAGQNSAVLEAADSCFLAGNLHDDESAWVAVWACRAAARMRDWGRAITWADRGLYLQPRDPKAEAALRYAASAVLMYIGDLLRAERELAELRQLVARVPALRAMAGDALYNLGHLKRLLRRNDEANRCFLQAAVAYGIAGRRSKVILCRYDLALTHLMAGRPDEALEELESVRTELDSFPDPELQAHVMVGMAWYYSLKGQVEESDRICRELREREELPPQDLGEIAWLQGSNALARGELEAATGYLEVAHQAAVHDWWPPLMERVNSLGERLSARGAAAN